MTRFADPGRCPDCSSTLAPGSLVCPSCRLDLSGPTGQRLFVVLTEADRLLGELRTRGTVVDPVAVPAAASAAPAAAPASAPAGTPARPLSSYPPPMAPVMPAAPPRRRLTVPTVLLGLGALTLLLAASLFIWVAWDLLGITGRTLVLLLLTGCSAGASAMVARRGLPGATEALAVVTYGLVLADVSGAWYAGWLGVETSSRFSLALGVALLVTGTVGTIVSSVLGAGRLVAGEAAAAVGGLALVPALAGGGGGEISDLLMVAVPLEAALVLASVGLRRALPAPTAPATDDARVEARPLTLQAQLLGCLAGLLWFALLVTAGVRAVLSAELAELWSGGEGLPLLAAGVYAVIPAFVPRLPLAARVASLAGALFAWSVLLTAPVVDEPTTTALATAAAVLTVAALAMLALPAPWSRAPVVAGALFAAPTALGVLVGLSEAGEAVVKAGSAGWTGTAGGRFDAVATLAPWLLPVQVLALAVALAATLRTVPEWQVPSLVRTPVTGVVAAVITVLATLVLAEAPVAVVLALVLLATVGVTVLGLRRDTDRWAPQAALLGAAALLLGAYDEWLALAALTVLLVLAGLAHRVSGTVGLVAGGLTSLLGAGLVWTGGTLLDVAPEWTALVALLALGAWTVVRGLDDGVALEVVGVEVGTLLAGFATIVIGVDEAPASAQSVWLAVLLTVAGVVSTVVSLTRPERRRVAGALGGVLLAAASWVRLADLGVTAPEAYTLPSALALAVVGWLHLRRNPTARTLEAWSPALGLALVPTLLWVLVDPASLRGTLLGLACLAMVRGGAARRWAAPFVWGSVVGGLFLVRLVVPTVFEFSPFLLFALGGMVLMVTGITWEQRLRDAERATGYVTTMR